MFYDVFCFSHALIGKDRFFCLTFFLLDESFLICFSLWFGKALSFCGCYYICWFGVS